MTVLQRRLNSLEKNIEAGEYLCGAIIRRAQNKPDYYASLWKDFSGLVCCMHGAFFDSEHGAAAWLCSELAGMKSLAVFFVDDQSLARMEVCTGGKMRPAEVDQSLWVKANQNGVMTYV
jgi:hypothetical protein